MRRLALAAIDYAPYDFIALGWAALARQGDERVAYAYDPAFPGPSRGGGARRIEGLEMRPIGPSDPVDKHKLSRRLAHELAWTARLCRFVRGERPRRVVVSNAPIPVLVGLAAQRRLSGHFALAIWVQDIHHMAIRESIAAKSTIRRGIGRVGQVLEHWALREADLVLAITESHRSYLRTEAGVAKVELLSNWSEPQHITPDVDPAEWRARVGLSDQPIVLYTGTLGRKHDLGDLLECATEISDIGWQLVVISGGADADQLASIAAAQGISNLVILPFQSWEDYPTALAAAEILAITLRSRASDFSVPSKTLSYLCAGRPIAAAVPAKNPVAELIGSIECGVIADPSDGSGLAVAVRALIERSPAERAAMGRRARAHAVASFDQDVIVARLGDLVGQLGSDGAVG